MNRQTATPHERESRYNIESLVRGLDVLSLFTSEDPALSLTEIVHRLNLTKSSVFRVLATLETGGYLERDATTRRYRPSLKVLQLGFTAINKLEVRQIARPYLERLAQELDETVSLSMLRGTDVIYVDRIRNRAIFGVLLDIGSRQPAHCTTMGKVLLANLSQEDLERFLHRAELKPYTPRTIVTRTALLAEREGVRKNGYAICDQELAMGLRAAGAPIHDNTGKTVAAINVSGAITTINLERLRHEIVPAVLTTAADISLALGFSNQQPPVKGTADSTKEKGEKQQKDRIKKAK
jgi:IclR family pca regulon transcriptional regulator